MILCSVILTLVIFFITKVMSLQSLVDTDPYQLSTHILDVSKLFYDFFMQYDKIFLQLIKKNLIDFKNM